MYRIDYRVFCSSCFSRLDELECIRSGFDTKEQALKYLEHGRREGWIYGYAYVKSQRVKVTTRKIDRSKPKIQSAMGTEPVIE